MRRRRDFRAVEWVGRALFLAIGVLLLIFIGVFFGFMPK